MGGEIPFLSGRNRGRYNPDPFFITFFLCSRFYCSPSASSLYLRCTPPTQGGACQLSMLVRDLKIPTCKAWATEEAWAMFCFLTILVSSVLSRRLRALPSEAHHQPKLSLLQPEVPNDSKSQLLDSSDLVFQAPGNFCLLDHMPQTAQAEPSLQWSLPDLLPDPPCPGPILPLQANLTRKGKQLLTHSPSSVILQGRYSG
jgi:hypothetical protein